MPIARDKWPFVVDAIRAVHKTTPLLIFGGHTHIRDCCKPIIFRDAPRTNLDTLPTVQFDSRSMALESGRYMETVGQCSFTSHVSVCKAQR